MFALPGRPSLLGQKWYEGEGSDGVGPPPAQDRVQPQPQQEGQILEVAHQAFDGLRDTLGLLADAAQAARSPDTPDRNGGLSEMLNEIDRFPVLTRR